MAVRVERCTAADLGDLAPLRAALWPHAAEAVHRREIARALARSAGEAALFLARTDDGEAVGFAEASLRREPINGCETSPVAFLEGAYVLPAHRRRGTAAALCGAVEAWAQSIGCTELGSDAETTNAEGLAFHAALGFAERERVVCFGKRLAPVRGEAKATDVSGWWRTPLVRPPRLRRGDRVAAVTPCWGGPAAFPARYAAGKRALGERFGLEVVESARALAGPDWLAAHPEARAADLMAAFADPAIKAVVATIGGDDAIRLIPHLDLGVIRDNPKLFIGYSDPTAVHFACLKAGVASLHGPTIMSGFAENGGMGWLTADTFERAAFRAEPLGAFPLDPDGWTAERLPWDDASNQDRLRRRRPTTGPVALRGTGRAAGRLIGGCAEVLEMLKGTPWWPPLTYWDGAILFYETSEEAPSETMVLRWLRNFAAQGILARLNGIALGRPGGAMDERRCEAQKETVLRALDEAGLHDLPVLVDLDIGHTDPIAALPYGALAEIDCERATLAVLEAAVA